MKTKYLIRRIPSAIEDDMINRPKLFLFLKGIQAKANKVYKDLSYELLIKLFWESFSELTLREKNIALDYFILKISVAKSAQKYILAQKTIENHKLRVKKKLIQLIFNRLEVERILNNIKKGKF